MAYVLVVKFPPKTSLEASREVKRVMETLGAHFEEFGASRVDSYHLALLIDSPTDVPQLEYLLDESSKDLLKLHRLEAEKVKREFHLEPLDGKTMPVFLKGKFLARAKSWKKIAGTLMLVFEPGFLISDPDSFPTSGYLVVLPDEGIVEVEIRDFHFYWFESTLENRKECLVDRITFTPK